MLDGFGEGGQKKLKRATVFIAGAGGLGSPVAIYLTEAGVGKLIVCDHDSPDLSNLNRQILHDDSRIGINKAKSAKITLYGLNHTVKVRAITEKITWTNAEKLVGKAAIIVDCLDNLETRKILNRIAIKKGIPLVYGGVRGLEGQMSFIKVPETPCLECILTEAPSEETFPIIGATAGIIGSMQALEVIKHLTGIGTNFRNKLLVWDGWNNRFKSFNITRKKDCGACGHIV